MTGVKPKLLFIDDDERRIQLAEIMISLVKDNPFDFEGLNSQQAIDKFIERNSNNPMNGVAFLDIGMFGTAQFLDENLLADSVRKLSDAGISVVLTSGSIDARKEQIAERLGLDLLLFVAKIDSERYDAYRSIDMYSLVQIGQEYYPPDETTLHHPPSPEY